MHHRRSVKTANKSEGFLRYGSLSDNHCPGKVGRWYAVFVCLSTGYENYRRVSTLYQQTNLMEVVMKPFKVVLVLVCGLIISAAELSAQMSWKIRLGPKDQLQKIVPPSQPKLAKVLAGSTDIRVYSSANNQSEVSIAINPANLNKLLIGANTDPGQGYYYSTNGGTNWSGGDALPGVGYYSSDPAVAYDADGNGYFNYLESFDGGWTYQLFVKKSADGGANWQSAVQIPNANNVDKNHMAIDVTNSPYRNYVYTAITDYDNAIKFSRSTNGGASFSTAVNISGSATGYFSQGVNLNTGPSGEVYAAWSIADDWPDEYGDPQTWDYGSEAIGFAKSTDGGATWQSPARIFNISGSRNFWYDKNPAQPPQSIRMNDFPCIAVDRSGGIWNGTIYLVYGAKGQGTDRADIMFCKSSNGGTNWSTPIRVNNDATSTDQWFPWITVDSYGVINIIFYDSRNDPNNQLTEVWSAQSSDGGQSFTNSKVSDVAFMPYPIYGGGYMGDYLGITSRDGKAYPCWMDNRNNGIYQVYTDVIDTYQADLLALAYANKSINSDATVYNNEHLLERGFTGNLHEVFMSGGEIFYRRSSDNGTTWQVTARLSSGNGGNETPSIVATVRTGTENLRTVWQRKLDNYHYEIWHAYSTNTGTSWSSPACVTGASYVTVSWTQSNQGAGQGPTPVVGSFFYEGMEGRPSFLLVYAAQEGLHYRLASTTTSVWTVPSPDIVPGSQGYYDPEEGWSCTYWHPCLASYNNQDYRVNLSYDDRYSTVYSQIFYEDIGWNSRQATAGSYYRYSSIGLDYNNYVYGVWSLWNGSQYVIRFGQANAGGTWTTWTNQFSGLSGGANSFFPAISYYNRGGLNSFGLNIIFRGSGNTAEQRKLDVGNSWITCNPVSSVAYPNQTHERSDSGIPRHIWADVSTFPYSIVLNSQNLPKSGEVIAAKLCRAAEIVNKVDHSQLRVELAEPVLATTSGTSRVLPFKEYDQRAVLSLSSGSIFDYLQTEKAELPADAFSVSFTLQLSASSPDTLSSGKLNLNKETPFTEIEAEVLIKDVNSSTPISGTGKAVLSNAKGLHNFSKTFTLPVDAFRGRSIAIVPSMKLKGRFNEQDLSFTLVNVFMGEGGQGGSSPTQPSISGILPEDINLGQNYPNPFNPVTTIAYRLTRPGKVSLKVFDVLGRELVTLVNSEQAEGVYSEKLDASRLASGIYFYQLVAPGVNETRKMLIAK